MAANKRHHTVSTGNPDVKRVVTYEGAAVALALRMSNGTWRLTDLNEVGIAGFPDSYPTAERAARALSKGQQ